MHNYHKHHKYYNYYIYHIYHIYQRCKNIPTGVKASIAFTVCSILQKGISIITVPIFTRTLSASQYGEINVFSSWLSIVSIFATLNLAGGGFNNGMLKYPDNRNGYVSSMQGLSTFVTAFVLLLYVLFPKFWLNITNLSSIVTYAMFGYLFFQPSISFWSAKNRYEYKYVSLVAFTLLFSIVEPLIGIIAVNFSEEKGIARILSLCFVNMATGFVFYCMNFIKGKRFYDKEYWKFALLFNVPLIPHYLSAIVLSSSDRIMISRMVGNYAVAFYSVSYNIGLLMHIVVTSINASYVPWAFETMKKEDYKSISNLSSGLVILIGLIAIVPIMFGPEAVRILGSARYMEAIWVIPPVAISAFLLFMYTLFANIEFYYEKPKYIMIASMIAAISNIILNYIFIKMFGYIAAGYTTLACYGLLVFLHYRFMKRILKIHDIDEIFDIKSILLQIVGISFLSSIFTILYNYTLIRYVAISIVSCIVLIKKDYFINTIRQIKD